MSGNSILRVLAFALLAVLLAACTTTGSYFSPQSSTDAANLQAPAADAVAADMVARLAEYVGPGPARSFSKRTTVHSLLLSTNICERGATPSIQLRPAPRRSRLPIP